jgi:hypothetical protein
LVEGEGGGSGEEGVRERLGVVKGGLWWLAYWDEFVVVLVLVGSLEW